LDKDEPFIVYTYHSLDRISLRGITKEMVQSALSHPDRNGTGYNNRRLAYKAIGNRVIKVVYTQEPNKYIIISIIWESGGGNANII
jgi:hypothetical protein